MFRSIALALALVVLAPSPAGTSGQPAEFPFSTTLQSERPAVAPAPPATWTDVQLAAPDPRRPIEEWYNCQPPHRDAVCVDGFGPDELVAAVVRSQPTRPDQWRPIVELYFESRHVARALRVMRCESGGDFLAKNPGSTASGLFQHLGSLWDSRSVKAGWGDADIFDPEANIAVAAWLVYQGGGWGHWDPSRHCWG